MGFEFLVDIVALLATGAYLVSLFAIKLRNYMGVSFGLKPILKPN